MIASFGYICYKEYWNYYIISLKHKTKLSRLVLILDKGKFYNYDLNL